MNLRCIVVSIFPSWISWNILHFSWNSFISPVMLWTSFWRTKLSYRRLGTICFHGNTDMHLESKVYIKNVGCWICQVKLISCCEWVYLFFKKPSTRIFELHHIDVYGRHSWCIFYRFVANQVNLHKNKFNLDFRSVCAFVRKPQIIDSIYAHSMGACYASFMVFCVGCTLWIHTTNMNLISPNHSHIRQTQ